MAKDYKFALLLDYYGDMLTPKQRDVLDLYYNEDMSLSELQKKNDFTGIMVKTEELKTMPFGDVWEEFMSRLGVNTNWYDDVCEYEKTVLSQR